MDKYNRWNFLKKKIALLNGPVTLFPKEGEIWMTAYGQTLVLNKMVLEKTFPVRFLW